MTSRPAGGGQLLFEEVREGVGGALVLLFAASRPDLVVLDGRMPTPSIVLVLADDRGAASLSGAPVMVTTRAGCSDCRDSEDAGGLTPTNVLWRIGRPFEWALRGRSLLGSSGDIRRNAPRHDVGNPSTRRGPTQGRQRR